MGQSTEIMSGQSSVTSAIIPLTLVSLSLLLLINIWSTKSRNQALSEDVGRAAAELDMAQYQREFCLNEVKETENERNENIAEVENVKNQLRKALEENNKGSGRQLGEALEKLNADIKKQETTKQQLLN